MKWVEARARRCILAAAPWVFLASLAPAQTAAPAPYAPPPGYAPAPPPAPPPQPAAPPPSTLGKQCTSHADCTGNQLCMGYRCTDPSAPPPPVAPAPAPAAPPPAAAPAPMPAAQPGIAPAPAPAVSPAVAPAPVGPTPMEGAGPPVTDAPKELPHVLLSSERLTGFGVWSVSEEDKDSSGASQTQKTSGISVALLVGTTRSAVPALVYHTPRLALDYVMSSHLTLGASVGIFIGSSTKKSPDGTSEDGPALLMYSVAPRLGYYAVVSDHFGFWPRAGITLYGFSESSTSKTGEKTTTTLSGVGVNLEPTLVFRPAANVGITASGVADIGVSGSQSQSQTGGTSGSSSNPSPEPTVTASNFGIMFGGYLGF